MIPSLLLLAALTVPQESWLVGAWAPSKSSCGSQRHISFKADGTYSEASSEGLWSLAGNQLTVEGTSDDEFGRYDVVRVEVQSGAEMGLQWPDGTRANFRRCLR